jgi:4-hydroxy-tetrahydrodipicolinate synthase
MTGSGVTGLFMNGLASEALMMPESDRIACAKTVLSAAKGKAPVMGNVIANSVNDGVEMAGIYAEIGADAVTITPPILYKYTSDGLYEYFDALASSVKLPVYIYNAPETGNKLPPQLTAKLFTNNAAFRGYKDSTQNIIEQQTLLSLIAPDRHFELLSGSDAQIATTMMLGGLGSSP